MELPRARTLEELIRWGAAQTPACQIVDVVIQDEYTHDVVLHYEGDTHLVFDTT